MSTRQLAIVQSTGFMPIGGAALTAQNAALLRTAQLAASSPASAGGTILAATAGGAPGTAAPPAPADLAKSAYDACFVNPNPVACATLNEQLGAQRAAQPCLGGAYSLAQIAKKRQGSMDDWFFQPTYVSPTKPTPVNTAAVAVSLATLGTGSGSGYM